MHYIFWVIAVFVLSILGLLAGKHYFTDPEASYREEVYSQFMQDGHLDRNELRTMLNKLPDSLHRDLELGAMCYKSGGLRAPDTIPFTCPTCGEKTIYSEKQSYSRKHYLTRTNDYKRLVSEIKGIDVTLDDSEFCRKCSPNIKEPDLNLIVRLHGETKSYRITIGYESLKFLVEFTRGKVTHMGRTDYESLLSDRLPLLESLLGVDKDKDD